MEASKDREKPPRQLKGLTKMSTEASKDREKHLQQHKGKHVFQTIAIELCKPSQCMLD